MKKLLVIDSNILPEVFEKVLEVKELLRLKKNCTIGEAVKRVGISRSSFYKYKDHVFSLSDGMTGHKATLSFMLKDEKGILSSILKLLSDSNANILTINQDIPINKTANVSITIEISQINLDINSLTKILENTYGVVKCELLALE